MASIVPAPLTSMAPPSRTTRQGLPSIVVVGRHCRSRKRRAILSLTASSFLWLGYLAQPLKRQLVIATFPAPFRTKSGQ